MREVRFREKEIESSTEQQLEPKSLQKLLLQLVFTIKFEHLPQDFFISVSEKKIMSIIKDGKRTFYGITETPNMEKISFLSPFLFFMQVALKQCNFCASFSLVHYKL